MVVTVGEGAQYDAALTALRNLAMTGAPQGQSDRVVTRLSDNRIRFAFTDAALAAMGATAVDQSIEVVRRRIDSTGTKEISITRQGADRIVVQAPGESDPSALERVIGQTAQLTFQMVDVSATGLQDAMAGRVPPDSELLVGEDGTPYLVKKRVLVSGENLTRAGVGSDQNGRPAIDFASTARARVASVKPPPRTSASPSPSSWTARSFRRRRSRAPSPAARVRSPATSRSSRLRNWSTC